MQKGEFMQIEIVYPNKGVLCRLGQFMQIEIIYANKGIYAD